MSADVEGWVARRIEPVPGDFRPWLEVEAGEKLGDDGSDTVSGLLADRGMVALREAVARSGRNREAAFRLLVADAYLTWAAEALLDGSDPESELRQLVRRVADEAA